MPREFLQRRYHRGLLKAGHCYGPFMNPAHNIVLNTVWYDTMFPAEEEYSEVAMICSRTLVSTACRSLLGLVAYLRACFPTVSRQQAIRYLLLAEVNLQRAIEMAGQEGHAMKDKFDRGIGFKAAATAAHHPDRDALVNFYLSAFFGPLPLKACGSFDVQLLSLMLSQEPSTSPHCSFETVPVLTEGASRLLSNIKQDFEAEQNFICSKGPEYDLHVICGLNPYVIKSGVSPLHYGDSSCKIRYKSKYSHVNFLASPRGSHSSDTVIPTLFFAECCNDNDITDEPLCWPIMGHPGRCFHCEYEGVKVVHPESQKYHGRDIDFEEMACKSHSNGIVNEDLVSSGESVTYSVGISQEDCIYFDFRRDVKCANFLNAHARMLEQRHCF
ncbi:Os03g0697600 [Oryza sativa Japonica Group]|uniref:Os03g0697600 protein n=1 Tax=Oryza sativa subsp. japonica TaxID=39947 RepID=A0A0P0W1S1_ORYSJ|nr:Os03g0697600 [Oryza sativa Japonica Group]